MNKFLELLCRDNENKLQLVNLQIFVITIMVFYNLPFFRYNRLYAFATGLIISVLAALLLWTICTHKKCPGLFYTIKTANKTSIYVAIALATIVAIYTSSYVQIGLANLKFILEFFPKDNTIVRDYLYNIRTAHFSGSLEYLYMVTIGFILFTIISKIDLGPYWIPLCVTVFNIGLFESSTLSRFYSPSLLYTLIAITISLISSKFRIGLAPRICILLLAVSLSLPIFVRSTIPGHSLMPFSDAMAMNRISEIRSNPSKTITGVSIQEGYDSINIQKAWLAYSTSLDTRSSTTLKITSMTDFLCSFTVGPLLEDRFCSNSIREWSYKFASNYLQGIGAPVISTSEYLRYAGITGSIIFSINLFLLITPIAYTCLLTSRGLMIPPTIYIVSPMLITKFIALYRGDPFFAGLSFTWMLLFVYALSRLFLSTKLSKTQNGSHQSLY